MRIERYLKKVRIFLLKRKFYRLFLWSIILISASLFVMIQLESIFYFHPKIKSFFLAFSPVVGKMFSIFLVEFITSGPVEQGGLPGLVPVIFETFKKRNE